jgi:hypothetical protein
MVSSGGRRQAGARRPTGPAPPAPRSAARLPAGPCCPRPLGRAGSRSGPRPYKQLKALGNPQARGRAGPPQQPCRPDISNDTSTSRPQSDEKTLRKASCVEQLPRGRESTANAQSARVRRATSSPPVFSNQNTQPLASKDLRVLEYRPQQPTATQQRRNSFVQEPDDSACLTQPGGLTSTQLSSDKHAHPQNATTPAAANIARQGREPSPRARLALLRGRGSGSPSRRPAQPASPRLSAAGCRRPAALWNREPTWGPATAAAGPLALLCLSPARVALASPRHACVRAPCPAGGQLCYCTAGAARRGGGAARARPTNSMPCTPFYPVVLACVHVGAAARRQGGPRAPLPDSCRCLSE